MSWLYERIVSLCYIKFIFHVMQLVLIVTCNFLKNFKYKYFGQQLRLFQWNFQVCFIMCETIPYYCGLLLVYDTLSLTHPFSYLILSYLILLQYISSSDPLPIYIISAPLSPGSI